MGSAKNKEQLLNLVVSNKTTVYTTFFQWAQSSWCSWQGHLREIHDSIVSRLGLEVGVEEKRVLARHPADVVVNAPAGEADTIFYREAALDDGNVVVAGGVGDVELGDGDFVHNSTQSFESSRVSVTTARSDMGLTADSMDGDFILVNPFRNFGDHALRLGVIGVVKVEVVDVEPGFGILEKFFVRKGKVLDDNLSTRGLGDAHGFMGGIESDGDEFLSQNAGKDRVP